MDAAGTRQFEEFFGQAEAPIRYALVASFGFHVGRDAAADAMVYAWENWGRLREMDNPSGYVFRVGQRRGRRLSRRATVPLYADPVQIGDGTPDVEPALSRALMDLTERQRQAVLLVHALGWTVRQAAELLDVRPATVQVHLQRGLTALRASIGVKDE